MFLPASDISTKVVIPMTKANLIKNDLTYKNFDLHRQNIFSQYNWYIQTSGDDSYIGLTFKKYFYFSIRTDIQYFT